MHSIWMFGKTAMCIKHKLRLYSLSRILLSIKGLLLAVGSEQLGEFHATVVLVVCAILTKLNILDCFSLPIPHAY